MNTPGLAANIVDIQEKLEEQHISPVRIEGDRLYIGISGPMTEKLSTAIDEVLEPYQTDSYELIINQKSPFYRSENERREIELAVQKRVDELTEGTSFGLIKGVKTEVCWDIGTRILRGVLRRNSQEKHIRILLPNKDPIVYEEGDNLRKTLKGEFGLPVVISDVGFWHRRKNPTQQFLIDPVDENPIDD